MPGELVEGAPLGILLPCDDFFVFRESNRAPDPVANHRPLAFGDDDCRELAHIDGEVVDSPEVDIGGHLSQFHGAQKVFGPGFDERTF